MVDFVAPNEQKLSGCAARHQFESHIGVASSGKRSAECLDGPVANDLCADSRKMADWLESWLKVYYSRADLAVDKSGEVFVPPLFLQHQGHSRTIVGRKRESNFCTMCLSH